MDLSAVSNDQLSERAKIIQELYFSEDIYVKNLDNVVEVCQQNIS